MPVSQSALFKTVPEQDFFQFFEPTEEGISRVNSRKVVDFLQFSKDDVATATNQTKVSIRYDEKMPIELRERIQEWGIAINLVGSFFKNGEKTMMWFRIPNPLLGNLSPRDMIRIGKFKRLMRFIQTALQENKP